MDMEMATNKRGRCPSGHDPESALMVLGNTDLFRLMTSFMRGLPHVLVQFYHGNLCRIVTLNTLSHEVFNSCECPFHTLQWGIMLEPTQDIGSMGFLALALLEERWDVLNAIL